MHTHIHTHTPGTALSAELAAAASPATTAQLSPCPLSAHNPVCMGACVMFECKQVFGCMALLTSCSGCSAFSTSPEHVQPFEHGRVRAVYMQAGVGRTIALICNIHRCFMQHVPKGFATVLHFWSMLV
eukprot:scaffold73888_cov22-Tisochrysis_lutea.AAC.1